jgi:hypothetical protein
MKPEVTIFAKGVVYLTGLAVLAVCAVLLPEIAREETAANPTSDRLTYPFLIGAWVTSIPIFVALHQTLKLINYIHQNKAFSSRSVKALQNIKICAIVFGTLIAVGAGATISWARMIDPTEEVTHIITLSFIFVFASSVIATFAAVLQRLLRDAIAMKAENDLTV